MTMLGTEQLQMTLRIATMVAPIALYFLLLGYLNTRRTPQLLTGRQDFAVLAIALSPLGFGPLMSLFGSTLPVMLVGVALLTAAIRFLSPSGRSFVIYNMPIDEGRELLIDILTRMGVGPSIDANGIALEDGGHVQLHSFPLLRNISLRMEGGDEITWRNFEFRLTRRLQRREVEPTPMAVAFLLLATVMLIAPSALMIHQMPELVRAISTLLQ